MNASCINFIEYKGFFTPPVYGAGYPALTPEGIKKRNEFIQLTQMIAREIDQSLSLDERLIIQFYASDSASFEQIRDADINESRLKHFYMQLIKKNDESTHVHTGFFLGMSPMQGGLSFLGTRPTIGGFYGGKRKKHAFDLVLDFKIGPAPSAYLIQYQDSLVQTSTWTGFYLGFEYAYDIISRQKIELSISPGIGYDGAMALKNHNRFGEDLNILSSFNLNGGLVFKYKISKTKYLGLQGRYNWVNYQNDQGASLRGGYFSLRLVFGLLINKYKDKLFKELDYVPSY